MNIRDGICSSNFENNNEVIEVRKETLCTNDIVNEMIYDNSSHIDFECRVILSPKNVDILTVNNEIYKKWKEMIKNILMWI